MHQINIFHEAEQQFITRARRTAKELLLRRQTVTVEDVLANCPRPYGVSKKANSKIFKHDIFRPVGYTRATTAQSNGHVIRLWSLAEEYFSPAELQPRERLAEDTT